MPLSEPAPRKHFHTRKLDMRGYLRDDGMWDIEGRLTDCKTYSFRNTYRGEIEAGEPLHDMWLRITIDDGFVVRAVEAASDGTPYAICPAIVPRFQSIVGLKVGPGWRRAIMQRLGGVQGCTHLVELLGAMATVAYQTSYASTDRTGKPPRNYGGEKSKKPGLINSCHAWVEDGPAVREYFPEFYTGEKTPSAAAGDD